MAGRSNASLNLDVLGWCVHRDGHDCVSRNKMEQGCIRYLHACCWAAQHIQSWCHLHTQVLMGSQWLITKLKDVRTIRNCRNTVESIQYTAEEASFPLAFWISVAFPLAFLSLSECTFLNLAISLNRNSEMTMLLAFASTWREGVDSIVVPPRHSLICLLGYFVLCS